MVRNYLKIAFRLLERRKGYALLNVLGLTTGLTVCSLIGLFILHEQSYDRFHVQSGRIYRLIEHYAEGGKILEESASVPFPVGPALADDYGVKVTRLYRTPQRATLLGYEDKRFYEPRFFFADSTVFDIFTFPLVAGDPATALRDPFSVVLTESAARRYFGEAEALGKVLTFEGKLAFRVTGVAQDPPPNTHFRFDFLASLQRLDAVMAATGVTMKWEGWFWNPCHTYVLLPPGMEAPALEATFSAFVARHFPKWDGESVSYTLQPLTDIHLRSNFYQEIEPNGSEATVRLFSLIGVLILAIACINFMNLATARSFERAREVGVRKVLGAERLQLMVQFLGEAVLMVAGAAGLAALLTWAFLPAFGHLLGTTLPRSLLASPGFWAALGGGLLLVAFLAGGYPAYVLSAFRPLVVLRAGPGGRPAGGSWMRMVLVVTQFGVSIALLVSAAVIFRQIQYLQHKDLGFDREQVVFVPIQGTRVKGAYEVFKEEAVRSGAVRRAAAVSDVIGQDVSVNNYGIEGREGDVAVPGLFAGADVAETLGFRLVQGESFRRDREADRDACLVNRSFVREVGWSDQAVGSRILFGRPRTVIGVTEDFHFQSLQQPIRPLVICFDEKKVTYLALRLAPGDPSRALRRLEALWARFEPDRPFDPFFLDERLDALYASERRLGRLFGYFSALAVAIACLGLFGLAAFTASQRQKEIGVRKVLGASAGQIVLMLAREVAVLVLVAFLLAAPLVYIGLRRWLDGFAYRIDVPVTLFFAAGLLTLCIALLSVSYQSLKAALADPVRSLRAE